MTFSIGKAAIAAACLLLTSLHAMGAQVSVAWDDNSTTEIGFQVERSTDATTFIKIGTVGANVVTFVDTSVASGTTYSYRVAAHDGNSVSPYSNVTSVTTAPDVVSPIITAQPVSSQTILAGASVTLSVAVSGTPAPILQWKKNGISINGATSTTFKLSSVTASDAGSYAVVASNTGGSVTSKNAVVAVSTPEASVTPAASVTPSTAPVIVSQPVPLKSIEAGQSVSLEVRVSGVPAPTIQWQKDGSPIPGATNSVLVLQAVTASDAGTYTVSATNPIGSVTSESSIVRVQILPVYDSKTSVAKGTATAATNERGVVPSSSGSSRLVNLSVRSIPGPDEQSLLVGFVVKEGSKSMLVRAIGPGLRTYTDTAVMGDPRVTISHNLSRVASNDDWGGTDQMKQHFARLGAFPLPDGSKDAAVLTEFSPRSYTANLTGVGSGLVMAEIYDADVANISIGRLVNVSARAHAGPGHGVLIVGFVISGDSALRVLVRAVGPTLKSHGVAGALTNPVLRVYQGDVLVSQNDDWSGSQELVTAMTNSGAFPLPDPSSKDSALIATLLPGAYTAVVSGVDAARGVALAEVYELR